MRMLRSYRISPEVEPSEKEEGSDREERENTSWASAIDDEIENWPVMDKTPLTDEKEMRTRVWVERRRSSQINAGRGRTPHLRRQPRFTGKWPDDRDSHPLATVRSDEYRRKAECPNEKSTTTDDYPHDEEGVPRKENTIPILPYSLLGALLPRSEGNRWS